jgi:hypothetical protein
MSSGSQDRDGDEVSFFKAVGIGAIWGLLPGVILGIAYAFTPSSKGISDILYTTLLFTIFSGFSGGTLGGFIVLVDKTIKFATWSLEFIGASISSTLFLLGSNALGGLSIVLGGLSVVIFPVFLILREYLLKKSPDWVKDALDRSITFILANLIILGFAWLFEQITGQQFTSFL